VQQQQARALSKLTQVQDTPSTQDAADQDLTPEESYQQTQYPEEYHRDLGTEGENTVLVFETPPGG
jgi:hypothetical protein